MEGQLTITPEYLAVCEQMHAETPSWGVKGGAELERVRALVRALGCTTVLDYGCGKGRLAYRAAKIGLEVQSYDPAFPPFAKEPAPADLVVCRDVMEHVEIECLDAVLSHISRLANVAAYFVIATRLATQFLPDGRNAHITVRPGPWWLERLKEQFIVDAHDENHRQELRAVCRPRKGAA